LPLRGLTSLYKEHVHSLIIQRSERGQRPNPISCVPCVSSIVLMGRETGLLQLLAPLLLTGGKGVDLVIRGDVVLNRADGVGLRRGQRRRRRGRCGPREALADFGTSEGCRVARAEKITHQLGHHKPLWICQPSSSPNGRARKAQLRGFFQYGWSVNLHRSSNCLGPMVIPILLY
jgi:hypothetical protein